MLAREKAARCPKSKPDPPPQRPSRTGLLKNLGANRRILFTAGLLGLAIGGTLTVLTSPLARPELFGKVESELSAVGEFVLRPATQEPFSTPP
jgi:hypothetical protein